ncbi:MAG: hypothetical protein ACRD0K_01655 [Egibacteraceae bacterium]
MSPRTRISGLVALVTVASLLAGLRAISGRAENAPVEPSAVPAPPEPEPAADLKPPIQGLIDNNKIPPASHFSAVQAFVVGVDWADLQSEPGGPIMQGNAIDQGLAQARALNAEHPGLDLKLKLRVYAGIQAPEWAKRLAGEPVVVRDPQSGTSGTVGRFWTDAFGRAYDELQAKLAARYDHVPEIREVVIARCATVFAEPFIRNTGDKASARALLDAGFTWEADHRCHEEQIDAHSVWERTRSALALNPYQIVSPEGVFKTDGEFTEQMMRLCRSVLGDRCILENNSIQWPVKPTYTEMYAQIRALGPPIAFQTEPRAKVGDLGQALAWAVEQGANSVELHRRYEEHPADSLATFDRALKANAVMQ